MILLYKTRVNKHEFFKEIIYLYYSSDILTKIVVAVHKYYMCIIQDRIILTIKLKVVEKASHDIFITQHKI